MKLIRRIGLGFAALISATLLAHAGGMFNNLPIVGGAAYCALYAGDAVTCQGNVPAGPSIVTGLEMIPADTSALSGVSPQTVKLSLASINALPYQYATPLTGASITVAATSGKLVLDPAGTIATLTVTLQAAAALVDGQTFELGSSQTVTALTLTPGSGTTIAQAPTTITVSTTAPYGFKLVYRAALTKWIRLL